MSSLIHSQSSLFFIYIYNYLFYFIFFYWCHFCICVHVKLVIKTRIHTKCWKSHIWHSNSDEYEETLLQCVVFFVTFQYIVEQAEKCFSLKMYCYYCYFCHLATFKFHFPVQINFPTNLMAQRLGFLQIGPNFFFFFLFWPRHRATAFNINCLQHN